jgi:hypothetical protein
VISGVFLLLAIWQAAESLQQPDAPGIAKLILFLVGALSTFGLAFHHRWHHQAPVESGPPRRSLAGRVAFFSVLLGGVIGAWLSYAALRHADFAQSAAALVAAIIACFSVFFALSVLRRQ